MPVRRRSNGSWLIDFRHERAPTGRFRKTEPGSLGKREVEALERRYRRELDEGPAGKHRRTTLQELFQRYWSEHARHLSWARVVQGHMDVWCDELGDATAVLTITSDDIAAAVGSWRGKISPSTINRRIAVIRGMWRLAVDVWRVPLQPVPWRKMVQAEPEPADRSLSVEVRSAYIEALPERSRWPSLMALHTGLRKSAVLGIERRHLDFERGVIHAITKGRAGGKPVTVPMTDAVLGVLMAMGGLPDVGRIFTISDSVLRDDRERARAAIGRADLRFHDLRHSFAQDLEDAGLGDIVPDALHHSTPALRRRYAKARTDRLREAINQAQRRGNGE